MPGPEENEVRIDKWLWAARFFKTRNAATQAVSGGRVHLNNAGTKPAKAVHVGDELRIRRGEVEFVVTVLALSARRGPATVARALYEESAASEENRQRQREQRRSETASHFGPNKRPGKRDRRLIRSFIRKEEE